MPKVARFVALGALFLIPLLPLYVDNSLFFPFITGKNIAFRALVEVAFFAWIILAVAEPVYRPRFSWTFAAFGALTVWMIVADLLAVNPHKAFWSNFERMDGFVTLAHVFLLFVVAGSVLGMGSLWKRWWRTFIAVAAVVCAYSLMQLGGVLPIHQGGVRVDATFGNAAYLAAYLLFAIAVTLWQALEEQGTLRYALYALGVVEALVLYFTATRGALLGALGAVFLGGVLVIIQGTKRTRILGASLLVLLVLLAGGVYAARHSAWVMKEPTLSRLSSISLSDGATRFQIWRMALTGVAHRPLTGWGQEGFNYVFNTYYSPNMYGQEPWFDRAHDIYLDWLIAGGFPALLFFLALLAAALAALYRHAPSRNERMLLICAVVAYAFQGVFVFDNLFTYVPLAIILAMAHSFSSAPVAAIERWKLPESTPLGALVAPLAVVAGLVVVWTVSVTPLRAAGDMLIAISPTADPLTNLEYFKRSLADNSFASQEIREQLLGYASQIANQPQIPDTSKQIFFQYALTQMAQEVKHTPGDARLRLEYALGLRAAGDFKDSREQSAVARTLSPVKQSVILEQGIEAWEAGDIKAARDLFHTAYDLDTSFPELAPYAAAGDIVTGNAQSAQAFLLRATGTTTSSSDIVMLAYYQVKDWDGLVRSWQARVVATGGAVSAHFGLAAAYAQAGRKIDARNEIQATIAAHPEATSEGASLLAQLSASGK